MPKSHGSERRTYPPRFIDRGSCAAAPVACRHYPPVGHGHEYLGLRGEKREFWRKGGGIIVVAVNNRAQIARSSNEMSRTLFLNKRQVQPKRETARARRAELSPVCMPYPQNHRKLAQETVSVTRSQLAKTVLNELATVCRKFGENVAQRSFPFLHQSTGLAKINAISVTCPNTESRRPIRAWRLPFANRGPGTRGGTRTRKPCGGGF